MSYVGVAVVSVEVVGTSEFRLAVLVRSNLDDFLFIPNYIQWREVR